MILLERSTSLVLLRTFGSLTLKSYWSEPVKVFVMNIYGQMLACNLHCVIFLCIYFSIVKFVLCL